MVCRFFVLQGDDDYICFSNHYSDITIETYFQIIIYQLFESMFLLKFVFIIFKDLAYLTFFN